MSPRRCCGRARRCRSSPPAACRSRSAGRRAGRCRRSRCRPTTASPGCADSDCRARCSSTAPAASIAGWPLNDDSAWAIAEICRQLEGMPLALELAAARVAVLAPEAIARGLEDALGLLTARSRAAEARHQTLRASLDWSYGLLPARRARRCCAARGVRRRHVARARPRGVRGRRARAGAGPRRRWRRSSSTRWSASTRTARACATGCWRPCASTRSSGSRTPASASRSAIATATRSWPSPSAQRREALTPRQPEVFAALDPEAANLAAALDRALETDPDKALRLCLALDFWFRARARFREADDAYARALAASDPPPALRARALAAWAWIVGSGGDFARANELAAEAAARAEASGDEGAIAATLLVLANHRFFTDPIGGRGAVAALPRPRARGRTTSTCSARAEALLRGAAWFQQDEAGVPRGVRRAALAARAARRPRDAGVVLVRAGRGPLPARRARAGGRSCSPERSPWRPRSARRPPTAPRGCTSR